MSTTAEFIAQSQQVLIGNYARMPIVMARGEGSLVFDMDGKRYVDMFAGFGGTILGHCHPDLIKAVEDQARQLWAVGNTFYNIPQLAVAQWLDRAAFHGQAFFCHGGLDANEAAVKLARLRGNQQSPKRWKVISFHRSFHGRSLAMIAATGNPKVKDGFEPMVPGFINVEADLDSVNAAIDDETAAILMEPIQGEGGVNFYSEGFAAAIRKICDEKKLTLIFDEVWTGGGRTGKWFGYQHFKDSTGKIIEPDILTIGKAIGGGLPVGVMFAKPEVAQLLVPGKHGSTLGANPICMAVAKAVFDVIDRDKLLDKAATFGDYAMARLKSEKSIQNKITAIRGRGLFFGIELKEPPQKFMEKAIEQGVIPNLTQQKVIRIAPALTISRELLDEGIDRLIKTIAAL